MTKLQRAHQENFSEVLDPSHERSGADRIYATANNLLNNPSEVGNLDEATIQWLIQHGVCTAAIVRPLALRSSRVIFGPNVNLYTPNPLGEFALILPVMANSAATTLDYQAVDLVAWSPKLGRIATRLGEAFALGEDQIGVDGLGTTGLPILVHRSPLGWLRRRRRGIVIVDWTKAAFALSGLILEAEDQVYRNKLIRRLTPIMPTIVASHRRSAA